MGAHKFSSKTQEMHANNVGMEDDGDCFLGQKRCDFGGLPGKRPYNKLSKVLPNSPKPPKSNSKQAQMNVAL